MSIDARFNRFGPTFRTKFQRLSTAEEDVTSVQKSATHAKTNADAALTHINELITLANDAPDEATFSSNLYSTLKGKSTIPIAPVEEN